MGTSLLQLLPQGEGQFLVRWEPNTRFKQLKQPVTPRYPEHCHLSANLLHCGDAGLHGNLRIDNLPLHAEVMLLLPNDDGEMQTHVLTGKRSSIDLSAPQTLQGSSRALFLAYLQIGVKHILIGIDHLLFVFTLLLLIGFKRQLLWTITAFTIAHSITLGLSVLTILTLPAGPVEALIALSIVLVAAEILQPRRSLARRLPWLIAFIFGLVHGLGFAGVLMDIGLPPDQAPLSLLAFNIGVELGQVAVIGLVYLSYRIGQMIKFHQLAPLRPHQGTAVLCYSIGTVAMYWSLERITGMAGFG